LAGAFSENSSKCVVSHILEGLHFLKSQGKSHLDIKPENILVGKDYTVKLGDFGFLTDYSSEVKAQNIGTQGYNSPQIALSLPFDSEKADVFSVGALMVTVLLRNPLFVDTDASKDYNFN
jgi:serine/threonine protein kinase